MYFYKWICGYSGSQIFLRMISQNMWKFVMRTGHLVSILCSMLLSPIAMGDDLHAARRFEITGIISTSDIERFDQFIKENPTASELLLTNSIGAHDDGVVIVREFKKRIDDLKIKTFVKGFCGSACADIFLLGYERTMLSNPTGRPSMLLLHPVRWVSPENENSVGQIKVQYTDELNKFISERSDGKITMDFLNKMYGADDSTGGIFILREANSSGKYTLFSPSIKRKIKAVPIGDLTPQEMGILVRE